MLSDRWGALALVLLGLLSAGMPATSAPPPARVDIDADAHASVAPPASDALPADDDAGGDVDSDDDGGDDASLTGAVPVALPDAARVAHRRAASNRPTPPDADELLRPPQSLLG